MAASLEAGHDAGVGGDAVAVFLCLEGLDEDGVFIAVIGHHQVLIAAAVADGEAAHVIGVEVGDGLDADNEFVCEVGGWGGIR